MRRTLEYFSGTLDVARRQVKKMHHGIEAIFLDLGNTLRILIKDELHQSKARQRIAALVGTPESPEAFCAQLDARYKTYRRWAVENLVEASEKELWTHWLLPDFPADQIAPLSAELTYQFRQSMGRRVVQRDGKHVVVELYQRGYCLGIISNVITEREIPEWLEADGLAPYFKSVVLSSIFGRRKPDPAIYLEAAHRIGVDPARCVYVGDNPARDVVGTRRAGFGMAIILIDPAELAQEPIAEENKPDLIIHQFGELLEIFPPRFPHMPRD
jgi:putative hydrolase of the HAD superfamily